tara:strand:+ start:3697 stop:3906 length:210 start_codon:yes stop_codon:yes gene_type:complete
MRKNNRYSRVSTILAVIAILSALGWAGNGDFRDEQRQFSLYCQHIFGPNPIWPDYKNVGLQGCEEELAK